MFFQTKQFDIVHPTSDAGIQTTIYQWTLNIPVNRTAEPILVLSSLAPTRSTTGKLVMSVHLPDGEGWYEEYAIRLGGGKTPRGIQIASTLYTNDTAIEKTFWATAGSELIYTWNMHSWALSTGMNLTPTIYVSISTLGPSASDNLTIRTADQD